MVLLWGWVSLMFLSEQFNFHIPFTTIEITGWIGGFIGVWWVLFLLGIGFGMKQIFHRLFHGMKPEKPQLQKKHHQEQSMLQHDLQELKSLPTDTTLQELIAHDGEIPDYALKNRSQ